MRSTDEWIGKHDDQAIPDRIMARVLRKYDFTCQGPCHQRLTPGRWAMDHDQALCNGGQHREGNLRPLCRSCHAAKTKHDVAAKKALEKQVKSLWIEKRPRRIMPGSRASRWKKKLNGQVVLRD